ncbi:MAG: hypothetical protein LIP12_14855 [Clostridiales bacterium]|nr:hypothetical protein [Clostridiales bacterium]
MPVTAEIIEIQKRWMDLDADTGYRISIGWYCFINGIGGRICYSSKDYNRLIGRDETRDGGRENPKVENDGGTETDDAE